MFVDLLMLMLMERSCLVDEFNVFINLHIPPCYSSRVNRRIIVGAFECLKLSVGIKLSCWCHDGSTRMCCLCVRLHFAQVTDCYTMVLNHICFCMGDSWVYIPSGSRSDYWKHKRFAEVLLDRHNKHMCYMVSFEAAPWISLAATTDLCPLHLGISCVASEGVAYSHWVITLFWKAHICLKSSLYASTYVHQLALLGE